MKKEIEIPTEGDQTKLLREIVENTKFSEIEILNTEDEPILAEGKIPLDREQFPRWSVGEYGIIRIEDRKTPLHIKGNNSLIYTTDAAVPILEPGIEPGYMSRSLRRFFEVINSNDITLENIGAESNNIPTDDDKPGFPRYIEEREFEHIVTVKNVKNFKMINCFGKNIWADGIYITGNDTDGVLVDKFILDGNGRQGTCVAAGKNIILSRLQVLKSRRGGLIDIEAPLKSQITDGVVVRSSFCRASLMAYPMAGSGRVDNVLIRDNYYSASGITIARATNGDIKNNYIIKGNTSLMEDGTCIYIGVKNILIEDEWMKRKPTKELTYLFRDCKNITFRNNNIERIRKDFGEGIILALDGTTTPEDVKVYGNADNVYFKYKDELIKAEEYIPTEKEKNSIPFEVSDFLLEEYNKEKVKVNFLPEVNDFIKSIIGDNFIPDNIIEKETPTPEPEVPVDESKKVKNFRVDYISGSGNIRIAWNKIKGVEKYIVSRKKDDGEVFEDITEHEFSNIVGAGNIPGVWNFTVKAVINGKETEPSLLELVIPEKGEPETPTEEEPIEELTDETAVENLEKILSYFKSKLNK